MDPLDAQTLQGVWAALPTPWTENFRLSRPILEENVRRYAQRGVAGVYTTDSDGEFYALELAPFRELVSMFGNAVARTSLGAAVGVTWSHTEGIIERIKAALDVGIPNVHVAFPYWMPLARDDVPRFFEDLAQAAPQARWIHYRSPHAQVMLSGSDYAHYQSTYPRQLIGTKLVSTDIAEIAALIAQAPKLAHFVTDYCAVPACLAGARGVYSYWVNTLPDWTLQTWRLCGEGRWPEAMHRQGKLLRWEKEFVQRLRDQGYRHGVIAKARTALSGFLLDEGRTRPPYYPVAPQKVKELRRDFEVFWAQELLAGGEA